MVSTRSGFNFDLLKILNLHNLKEKCSVRFTASLSHGYARPSSEGLA